MGNKEAIEKSAPVVKPKISEKDLIEKAKMQYSWYTDMYPKDMQDKVARNLLQLELGGAVGCIVCGIPSGMSGLTMRKIKIKDEKGKLVKKYMCPHCMSEQIKKAQV